VSEWWQPRHVHSNITRLAFCRFVGSEEMKSAEQRRKPVLRIRDVYPGSRIRLFSIPDPGSELFPSRIPDPHQRIKYFSPKWFLRSKKYDPGGSSRIPDPDFLPIPDPGSRGQKGTGSRIRISNTGANIYFFYFLWRARVCWPLLFLCRAHLWFLRDVWIRIQRATVASWRAFNLRHPSPC
jgi:hypothetical protein